MLQLAYLVLPSYGELNVYLAGLRGFRVFTGFAVEVLQESGAGMPPGLGLVGYRAMFLNNCNVMLLLMIIELFVAGVLYLMGRLSTNITLTRIGLTLLKQGFIFLVMFNVLNVSYAIGVDFVYNQGASAGNTAAIFFAVAAVMAAVYFLNRSSPEGYGEFRDKFKPSYESQMYISLSIGFRIAVALWLPLELHYAESTLLVSAVALLFILYNLVNLPFLSPLHNYRACLCHFCCLLILLAHSYYASMRKH